MSWFKKKKDRLPPITMSESTEAMDREWCPVNDRLARAYLEIDALRDEVLHLRAKEATNAAE